ncbi:MULTISPECIES: LysR substrate-binding domain-containing protein [Polaromonas]|uniref:LysR substrate-binding domain-containing protein n=1 Tax=Polaromonas aquatica TaxID=332657 RepID=A0ABW1U2W0_9BURK
MELRQMRYFTTLAQERNFHRAAERLHMTQPPLTRQIRMLEDEVGAPLFIRTAKGVELTDAGQTLFDDAPKVLALAQLATDRAKRTGAGLLGQLDVGIFGSGVLNVIPKILAAFHAARPDVKIRLHNMTKGEQIEALRERRITIGFHRLPPAEKDLKVHLVLREPMLVGLFEGHPLCAKKTISLQDLEDQPMILYPNTPMRGMAQEIISAFQKEKVRLCIEQEVEDVTTCVALVSGRFGLCITTESGGNLRLPGMVYRPLKSRFLKDIELSCIHNANDKSPVLAALLQVIRKFPKT